MAGVVSSSGKSHFGDDCEKARAVVRESLSFAEFCLDGVCRRQLAISMWLGARGAGMEFTNLSRGRATSRTRYG